MSTAIALGIIACSWLFVLSTDALICACNGPNHNCQNGTCMTAAPVCYTGVAVFPNSSYRVVSYYCPATPLVFCRDPEVNESGFLFHVTCCKEDYCNSCPNVEKLQSYKAYYNLDVNSSCLAPTLSSSGTASPSLSIAASTFSNTIPLTTNSPSVVTVDPPDFSMPIFITVLTVVFATVQIVLLAVCVTYCVRRCHRHHDMISPRSVESPNDLGDCKHETSISESLLKSNTNQIILTERTIGDDLETIKQLGRGSFGTVYLAMYHGEKIAVKSFHPAKIPFFQREEEIYNTSMLNNNNILRFIASDSHFRGNCSTEPILIFEYISRGNLSENLRKGPFSPADVVKLCLSILSGLEYLHHQMVTSAKRKPGIAHRDLKSPNILVRDDTTCCIADLGLAVRENGVGGVDRVPPHVEGTRRYLPPEVLTTERQPDRFSFYRAGDIYSVSLVLWEIVNSSPPDGQGSSYSVPFEGLITGETTEAEVRNLIVNKNERPAFKPEILTHKTLGQLVTIIKEGWDTDPNRRPSSLNIKKRIARLM